MVYVDSVFLPFKNMKMCHMFADTTEELMIMADRIGLSRKHIQHKGEVTEHFDVCISKRELAIQCKAQVLTNKECAKFIAKRLAKARRLKK